MAHYMREMTPLTVCSSSAASDMQDLRKHAFGIYPIVRKRRRQNILTSTGQGCFATQARTKGRLKPAPTVDGLPKQRRMERSQARQLEFSLAGIGIFAGLYNLLLGRG